MNEEEKDTGPQDERPAGPQADACEQCAEYLAGWKRALADYANLQGELGSAKAALRALSKAEAAEAIIPVLDNFDQAVKWQPEDLPESAKGWLAGILHVRTQLEEVMKTLGAEPFGEAGDAFDPHVHEAVEERSEEGNAPGTVLEVAARGWKHGDKLIRPAKVIVCK